MKYVILIHGNAASRAVWDELSPEQRRVGLEAYEALNRDLAGSGELVVAEALGDPGTGRRLPAGPAGPAGKDAGMVTDGPFAEAKEFLAGFILVDVPGMERALEIAARVPEADLGLVEVRPATDLRALEG